MWQARSSGRAAAAFACLLLFSSLPVKASSPPSVYFVDSHQASFLKPSASADGRLSASSLGLASAALLGVAPASDATAQDSEQVADVVASDVFSRPRAVFTLLLDGLDGAWDDALVTSVGGRQLVRRDLEGDAPLVDALVTPCAPESSCKVRMLNEQQGICSPQQQDIHLRAIASTVNAVYTPGESPLEGKLSLEDVTMDLSSDSAAKAWASELAAVSCVASALANSENRLRLGHRRSVTLYVASLQALASIEAASPVRAAAAAITVGSLKGLMGSVEEVSGGRLVTEVVLAKVDYGAMSTTAKKARVLLGGEGEGLGRGLADDPDDPKPTPEEQAAEIKEYINHLIVVITSIILLVAAIWSCCALCNMPLTQDSLLYPRTKQD